jgi:hypothetical protein
MSPRDGPPRATKCNCRPYNGLGATHTEPAPTKCEDARAPAGADTHDKIESHDAAARSEFWNFAVKARIRCELEHGRAEIASFFRADRSPGVTESVSFGTWNRVSHGCSITPKLLRKPVIPGLPAQ